MAFHISPKDGQARPCKAASTESCPLGGAHYENEREAQVAAEEKLNALYDTNTGLSKKDEAFEDQMNEETFGYIRELKGQERAEEIANAEAILARSYSEAKVEVAYSKFKPGKDGLFSDEQLDDSNYPEVQKDFSNQLAAIHGVAKDRVAINSDGDFEIERADGEISIYNKSFEPKATVGNYETDEGNEEILKDTYSYIQELNGSEREKAIANAEALLAREYADSKYESELIMENPTQVEVERDTRRLNRLFRDSLSALHGVAKDRVVVNSEGDVEVDRADGKVSIYNQNFELKGVARRTYETDEGNAKNTEDAFGYIKKLKGAERKKAIAEAEASLASEYLESKYELKLRGEGSSQVEKERDLRQLERTYSEIHAVLDEKQQSFH